MYSKLYRKLCQLLKLFALTWIALELIISIFSGPFATHYKYIAQNKIYAALVEHITPKISEQLLNHCDYKEVIAQNHYVYEPQFRELVLHSKDIQPGGEYFPKGCRAKFSTAIIVPYRERAKHLHDFLIYMHNYLRMQKIHYRIFVVEQNDTKPFNRAKLFNIGAFIAEQYKFSCLIFHDVDLLPLNSGQMYACTEQPRHMCPSLDIFRFNLPYRGLFGGVVSIRMEQFRLINGISNMFQGWGGEDDDFYDRLKVHNISICRFEPSFGEYTMLKHPKEKPNQARFKLLQGSRKRAELDGLNSLKFKEKARHSKDLFTHILVET